MSDGLSDNEEDPGVLWAEIHRLRAAVAGPAGYASWQDAAIAERVRRVKAEQALAAERERDAAASKQAWVDVLAERCRQIEVEGWTPEHDDCHRDGSLAKAAYCYAWAACGLGMESPPPAPPGWPWAGTWWKPRDTRSNLVRAAALLLAEIDRLDRQAGEKT